MARKPKRTRREIEEALLRNVRVNMTPAEAEDAADKRKRQKRRSAAKRGLEKELAALTLAESNNSVQTVVTRIVDDERPTEGQEGKQEEDDPAEHQRRYAAAYAEGVRAAESEAVLAATSTLSTPDRAAAIRARNAERARIRRANMPASQKERTKIKNRERAKASRARRTEEQLIATREAERVRKQQRRAHQTAAERSHEREQNRIQQQLRRAAQTSAERQAVQQQNRARGAARRAGQTDEEREAVRRVNRVREAVRRAGLSDEARETVRQVNRERDAASRAAQTDEQRVASQALDRERHAVNRAVQTDEERSASQTIDRDRHAARRAGLTEEEVEAQREQERIRRKSVKRCHGHVNHEDFRASMVTGENVVNGRHRFPPTVVCPLCQAWKWPDESDFICCMKGRVRLHPLQPAPGRLLELYGESEFRRHIRAYNQAFAFTSIGASSSDNTFRAVDQDQDVTGQHGIYSYRIQGAMGHYLGSMLPYVGPATGERTAPKFAQIYIVDPDMQARAQRRKGIYADLDNVALKDIEDMMERCNPFAQQFLNFGEKLRQDLANGVNVMDIQYRLHAKPSQPGTHNLPTVSEVGAALIEDGNIAKPRDLLLLARDHQLLRLFETDEKYDPLQYPLLFPHGDLGWTHTLTYADGAVYRNKRKMALREHTAYRLFQKVGDQSALRQGGRLFQQWVVDQRAKCEQEQLRWVATHQKEIRANQYHGVEDALLNENTITLDEGEGLLSEYDRTRGELVHPDRQHREDHFLRQIGKRVILPDSHVGGPRFMYKAYQDSMAIVREYGKPDVFVTMTCNPKWEEIEEKITDPLQSAQDRPDIVARVWQQKLKALLKDLDEGVLGRLLARIYVVEFQKRGLPHAHILIILEDEDKPRTREIIDKLVSTELPDKNVNPDLFDTVMTCMMHGPCGEAFPSSPCMKDGKCSKGFPKPLVEVTRANPDGYPVYRRRRREPGVLTYKGKPYDNETVNQWVVPYNPYLSQKYNCHINVEVCTAITAIKYMYKYVYKGSDRAVITIEAVRNPNNPREEPNEILRFLNARYISPVEACMRLSAFEIQGKTHTIIRLTVHLEGGQMIVFEPTDDPAVVAERGRHTTLTSFFELCASEEPEDQIAKTMLYHEIPKKFSWDNKAKKWVRRSKYQAAIGRLIHVSPRDIERFYLRVLLCHRRGPTSFKDLQTVDGVVHPTFQKAAMYAGFLENDQEWVACMSEASSFKMPKALRQLFATLLVYSQVSDVRALWDQFYGELSRDFAFTYRNLEGQTKEDTIQFHTLKDLNDLLQISGYVVHHFELPQLCEHRELVLTSLLENNLIRRELEGYNHDVLQGVHDRTDELNDGQRAIYDQIMDAVERPQAGKKLFFVDGPGGTGKSTLLKHILASVRLSGKIAIAVASSGIAALLLMGGRTAHSTFKIPLKLNEHSTCSIYKQSKLRKLLQAASLIIWDEAPMTHRHAFEAVDRSLRDILDNDQELFGGKTFVLSGDFRQILPVVVRGTPAETIDACLKSSTLWPHFQQVRLTENMRVRAAHSASTAAELAAFSDFLLQVGEGRHEVNRALGGDYMKPPRDMLVENPPEERDEDAEIAPGVVPIGLTRIVDAMYADINNPAIATDDYFANRTILTTTNAMVHRINDAVSARLDGDAREYRSIDSVQDDEESNFFE